MSIRRTALLAILLLGACAWAAPSLAQKQPAAVGGDGEIFTVLSGSYGDLFPGQGLTDPSNPVLALDLVHSDGSHERLLVPGTESEDFEDSTSLLVENSSDTVYLLWQTRINFIHSSLNLASFRDGAFSPVIEIWGSPFGWKTSPQFAVTRDQFQSLGEDGQLTERTRTVVHVIWGEEGVDAPKILYSPIVLLDGTYIGKSPVYELRDLALDNAPEASGPVDVRLASASRIQPGRNMQTVVVGFTNTRTGMLDTLEMETLPGEMVELADTVRDDALEQGNGLYPGEPSQLGDKLRHQIIELGHKLGIHPSLSSYAADVTADQVTTSGQDGEGLNSLADRLRHQIIEIGARMTDRGIDRGIAKSGFFVVDASENDPTAGEIGSGPSLIRISTAASHPIPVVATPTEDTPIKLYLSRDGSNALVAWPNAENDALIYRETRTGDWSEPFVIAVGEEGVASMDRAFELVKERAESRHDSITH